MFARLVTFLRRSLNPGRVLTITPLGRVFLMLTLGIGLGALNTGNNLLYLVLGLMLSTIVVSGVLSERVIWDLQVRRLLPDGAFAHEPFAVRYELRRTRGQAFAIKVREPTGLTSAGAWATTVLAGTPGVIRCMATAPRRGPLELTAVELSTTFPFGIFEKKRTLAVRDTLLVYPRRGFFCEAPPQREAPQLGDSGRSAHRDGTADLANLRELAPGEDARRIHWARSASAARLITVEREREERRQITLDVDVSMDLERLDQACEEAAGQTAEWMQRGFDVGLTVGGTRLRPAAGSSHEKRILAALAMAGFRGSR